MKKFKEFVTEKFDAEHAEHVKKAEEARQLADANGHDSAKYHAHMADHHEHMHKAVKAQINKLHDDPQVRAMQHHVAADHMRRANINRALANRKD